jgi:hypothetical protein
MRDKFPGYFRPNKSEFDAIWKEGLIVPDTNILLHLLRFKRETRDVIIKTLNAFRPRLWLPHQVAFEFSRRWLDVDEENRISYEKLKESITRQGNTLSALFDAVARYQIVDAAGEKTKVEKFVKDLCKSVDEASKNHPNSAESEKIVDEVSSLFADNMGEKPKKDDFDKWISEAAERYTKKIPPGYKDERKDGLDKYGDYILWREMMQIAKSQRQHILFLSDDRKEDWALTRNGQDKGPLPEIMQEFWEETGQRFYSYPLTAFLDRAKDYANVTVSKQAIKDVEAQAKRRLDRAWREEREFLRNRQLERDRLRLSELQRFAEGQISDRPSATEQARRDLERMLHNSERERSAHGITASEHLRRELERSLRAELERRPLGATEQARRDYERMLYESDAGALNALKQKARAELEFAAREQSLSPLEQLADDAHRAELEELHRRHFAKPEKQSEGE